MAHAPGARVEARWPPRPDGFAPNWPMAGADRRWYAATVESVSGGTAASRYTLRYDAHDGHAEGRAEGVGSDHVRAPAATKPAKKRRRTADAAPAKPLRRCCVPFCHPGAERDAFGLAPPDSFLATVESEGGKQGGIRLKCPCWTLSEGDQRYVIEHLGRVASPDARGGYREGRAESLRCWAEYSGPAQLVVDRGRPDGGYDCSPTRVSKVFMDSRAWGLTITDNDPCIFFGFNYTLCKQHSAVRLAALDGGSLILFGSVGGPKGWQQHGTGVFFLDTLFVVGESAEVSGGVCDREEHGSKFSDVTITKEEWSSFVGAGRIRDSLKDRDVPAATREAWLKLVGSESGACEQKSAAASHPGNELPSGRWPTRGSKGPEVRRVYKGVGFGQRAQHDGMFSFVPSWRGDGLRQRPSLDLDALSALGMSKPKTAKSAGRPWSAALNGQLTGSTDPLQPTQLQAIWKEVAAQVQQQGFGLGCWFAPPPPMPAELAEALEGGVELPEKAAVEMAESDTGRLRSGVQVRQPHSLRKEWSPPF